MTGFPFILFRKNPWFNHIKRFHFPVSHEQSKSEIWDIIISRPWTIKQLPIPNIDLYIPFKKRFPSKTFLYILLCHLQYNTISKCLKETFYIIKSSGMILLKKLNNCNSFFLKMWLFPHWKRRTWMNLLIQYRSNSSTCGHRDDPFHTLY